MEVAKEKKRVEVEAVKEKKRIEVEVAKEKKLDNKDAKNVQTALEKAQINKRKAALLANNLLFKKKPQKLGNHETPIIELASEPKLMSEANSLSED